MLISVSVVALPTETANTIEILYDIAAWQPIHTSSSGVLHVRTTATRSGSSILCSCFPAIDIVVAASTSAVD
jgi:hypothetical protein